MRCLRTLRAVGKHIEGQRLLVTGGAGFLGRTLCERLRVALAQLPERRRLAVVLFDVEGYSHAEIADILGIPEGTARSEVFHARRALRVLLQDWKEEG